LDDPCVWERCLTPLAQKRFEPQNRHSSAKIAAQSFAVIAQRAKANGRKGYFLALMPARASRLVAFVAADHAARDANVGGEILCTVF